MKRSSKDPEVPRDCTVCDQQNWQELPADVHMHRAELYLQLCQGDQRERHLFHAVKHFLMAMSLREASVEERAHIMRQARFMMQLVKMRIAIAEEYDEETGGLGDDDRRH
jgi:hypothetical protein